MNNSPQKSKVVTIVGKVLQLLLLLLLQSMVFGAMPPSACVWCPSPLHQQLRYCSSEFALKVKLIEDHTPHTYTRFTRDNYSYGAVVEQVYKGDMRNLRMRDNLIEVHKKAECSYNRKLTGAFLFYGNSDEKRELVVKDCTGSQKWKTLRKNTMDILLKTSDSDCLCRWLIRSSPITPRCGEYSYMKSWKGECRWVHTTDYINCMMCEHRIRVDVPDEIFKTVCNTTAEKKKYE